MSNTDFQIILNDLTKKMKTKYTDFLGIYFFGSRVKKMEYEASDYDITLLFGEFLTHGRRDELIGIIYEINVKHNIFIDPQFISIYDIQHPSPLIKQIVEEGIFYGI